jgi:hypothetical protein
LKYHAFLRKDILLIKNLSEGGNFMKCLLTNKATPFVYDLFFRLNTFYLTMTRSAAEYVNRRVEMSDKIARRGFKPISTAGFGIQRILQREESSIDFWTASGEVDTWLFEITRNCDPNRITYFLETIGIVTSILSEFSDSEKAIERSQLLTIGGISSRPCDSKFAINIILSQEVMARWNHSAQRPFEPEVFYDLLTGIRRHAWRGESIASETLYLKPFADGYIESITCMPSGAGLVRCRQFISGHGALFYQHNIQTLQQQVLLLCVMTELAAPARMS